MHPRRSLSRIAALLRYHRTSQFAWRIRRIAERNVRKLLPAKLVYRESAVAVRWRPGAREACRIIADHRLRLWPERRQIARQIACGRFSFLNQTICLGPPLSKDCCAIDWNPDAPRLWRFHLQCHEFLLELAECSGPEIAYALISSWIHEPRHHTPLRAADPWHPFCISRRLPVWLGLAASYDPPAHLAVDFWRSISNQIAWLRRNCEWDLGGNHLLENLTALYLADSFLQTDSSSQSVPSNHSSPAPDQLVEQLNEQILDSGEHDERSPTYHALMMVCVLQCCEAAQYSSDRRYESFQMISSKMLQFAKWLRQPNGRFPLLGDSAHRETPELEMLFTWSEEHWDPASSSNPAMNYWAHQNAAGDRILFDVGALACNHLPAHGHADLLQITADLGGREAIVDTGNYDYAPSEMRHRCRRTDAHNVLQLGAREQCELWSSFRMGRRGHIIWTRRGTSTDQTWCAAAHDGYECLSGRLVIASPAEWTIIDWFSGCDEAVAATTRLHWHPDWELDLDSSLQMYDAKRSGAVDRSYTIKWIGESCRNEIAESVYCPSFGERQRNSVAISTREPSRNGWLGYVISLHPCSVPVAPMVRWDDSVLDVTLANGFSLSIRLNDGTPVDQGPPGRND